VNNESSHQNKKSRNIRIVGITDGNLFDKTTWSGCSYGFFTAIQKIDCLYAGISGLPPQLIKRLYQLKNFSWGLKRWKFKYHIDIAYFEAMTRKVEMELSKLNDNFTHIIQVFSFYDVPSIIENKNVVTCAFQDGNLIRRLNNPFGHPHISPRLIDKAMQREIRIFRRLDYIFTFSEWLRQSFINEYNIKPDKVFTVGAGANIPIPETNNKQEFDGRTILFIGIDFERKGGKILLEAFRKVKAELSDARLIIIGPNLKDLPDGVECLGYISKNSPEGLRKLKQAYSDASVFTMPSLYEPFGVVFLEAMAHGLPCIGADNCAMPEIIDHEKTGFLVPARDPECLANRIIELLKDVELAKAMGNKGENKFINNFTWNHVAERVVDVLRANM